MSMMKMRKMINMRINTDIINKYMLLDELNTKELIQFSKELGIKNIKKMTKMQIKESIEKKLNVG